MNTFWTISHYLFKKTWFCIHWHSKNCFRSRIKYMSETINYNVGMWDSHVVTRSDRWLSSGYSSFLRVLRFPPTWRPSLHKYWCL